MKIRQKQLSEQFPFAEREILNPHRNKQRVVDVFIVFFRFTFRVDGFENDVRCQCSQGIPTSLRCSNHKKFLLRSTSSASHINFPVPTCKNRPTFSCFSYFRNCFYLISFFLDFVLKAGEQSRIPVRFQMEQT